MTFTNLRKANAYANRMYHAGRVVAMFRELSKYRWNRWEYRVEFYD